MFYSKLACHLVVRAGFRDLAKQLAIIWENLQGKRKLFRSLSPQPPLLVFNSDFKLRATETLI